MKTTLEKANERRHEEINNSLQSILEKNYDAEKGYKKAMEEADSSNLKEFLKHQALQRNRFATEISHEIFEIDEKPKEGGSAAGTLHRAWMDIKTAFTGNDDEAILEEVIRGEKASVEEYENILKNEENALPLATSNVLKSQLDEINSTLNRVKTLEDIA